jgi:hypothetical protein
VSNEHQEQGAKVRDSRPIASLSNAAIDVQGQRKIASYGLSRYKIKVTIQPQTCPPIFGGSTLIITDIFSFIIIYKSFEFLCLPPPAS